MEDLMPLKTNKALQPRAPNATSIPGMIQLFQNEWDAVMLETYTLNKHIESVRQELAHALYQHDAACRVIARLIKERDDARANLGNTQDNVAMAMRKNASGGEDKGEGIAGDPVKIMTSVAKNLSKNRKATIKDLSTLVARKESFKKYTVVASHNLHSPSVPGILALDLHPTNQDLVLTGGADGSAIVFNRSTGKTIDTLKSHKKKITDVKFHPTENMVFTTSSDNSAILWSGKGGKFAVEHTLGDHSDEVCGITIHPSGRFAVTASLDKTWCFNDVLTGQCRQKVLEPTMMGGFSQVQFHPDGILLGTGTVDNLVRIFDVTSQKQVAPSFKGHNGKISALTFSENGYYLATGDDKGMVKLWDLRKLANFHNIDTKSRTGVHALEFDSSGTYLGIAGADVSLYVCKQWETVKTWTDHTADVTGLKFGKNAEFFVTASKDRSFKVFSEA
jgi:pre-mRNA-processing factor 19